MSGREDTPGLELLVITIGGEGYRFDLTYGVSVAVFKLKPSGEPLYRVDNFLWWEEAV